MWVSEVCENKGHINRYCQDSVFLKITAEHASQELSLSQNKRSEILIKKQCPSCPGMEFSPQANDLQ